jgi:hypothetical protein
MTASRVRIAAIQARPVSEEFDALWAGGDVPHAVDLLEQAARGGATCAVFPELYPRVGEAELCAAARRLGLVVVAGLAADRGSAIQPRARSIRVSSRRPATRRSTPRRDDSAS